MDWLPYLKQLSLRPRALKYTGIYELMPETMQTYLATCSSSEVGQILKILSELTDLILKFNAEENSGVKRVEV